MHLYTKGELMLTSTNHLEITVKEEEGRTVLYFDRQMTELSRSGNLFTEFAQKCSGVTESQLHDGWSFSFVLRTGVSLRDTLRDVIALITKRRDIAHIIVWS